MKTIQEYLIDALRKTTLYEMAKNQSDCENTVRYECGNILTNLVLLNYFKISGLSTTNISHWKQELVAAIMNARSFKVRKDNSISRRERIVNRVFDEEDMYDEDYILIKIDSKLQKEEDEMQLNCNKRADEWLGEAITATTNQLGDIKELIVWPEYRAPKIWADKTFGN